MNEKGIREKEYEPTLR